MATSEELIEALGDGWQQKWPNLENDEPSIESEATEEYNCVAWALGITDENWDPVSAAYDWPRAAPRSLLLTTFITVYRSHNFEVCQDESLESALEKIALYADDSGLFQHVARQLPEGNWTSKLGDLVDISHKTPRGLEGPFYGRVASLLSRRWDQVVRV